MDRLNAWWKTVAERFGKMSSGERVAVGGGAGVIVLSLALTLGWTARSEYVPIVFNQLDPVQTGDLLDALGAAGFATRLEQGKVLVRSGDLDRARIAASRSEALPTGKDAFAQLVDSGMSFDTPKQRDERYRVLLQRQLASGIRTIEGVRDAQVLLTAERDSPLKPQHQEAKASVLLTLRRGEKLPVESVRAIRSFVAGSWPGLKTEQVHVQDSAGHAYPAEETEGPFGGAANQLAIEREWEREVAAKVREAFGYIEDPVYVVADLQLRPVDLAREEVGAPAGEPASDVALPLQHTSEHTETSTAAAPPPTGVSGNLATNLAASAPGMNTSIATTESEVTGYQMIRTVKIQEREVRIAVVDSSISVTVPWLRKKGADGVLTYEDPSPLFAEYQGKIGRATGIVDAKIHLSAYQPEPPPLPEGFVSQAGTLLVENFGTVALTCLALVALGVLGSLARHAFAPLASEAALAPPGGAIVEKGEERPVDDREARVQQVVDRDPALAAGLVKRWLSGA